LFDESAPALPLALTRSSLHLPRLSLTTCVRAVLLRNTTGLTLNASQRLNYYPATPLCSLLWLFEGDGMQLPFTTDPQTLADAIPTPGRILFAGPQNQPNLTYSHSGTRSMLVLLTPDALQAITGVEPQHYLNRSVPADAVLPRNWMAMCEAVVQAPSDDVRIQYVEDFLDPLWQSVRPSVLTGASRYDDWVQGLALRAATSGLGRSLRQIERRIKQWSGQPLRDLRGISRAERAFFQALASENGQAQCLTNVAIDNGYADQSHLTRETRRIAGFPPDELRRKIETNEAFWIYRLWR
jgi:AraC-like DNA-binding protein